MYLALDEAAEFIGCYPQLHNFAYRSRENSYWLPWPKRREQLCKTGDDEGGDDLVIATLQTRWIFFSPAANIALNGRLLVSPNSKVGFTLAHQRWLPSPKPTATYPDDTSNL